MNTNQTTAKVWAVSLATYTEDGELSSTCHLFTHRAHAKGYLDSVYQEVVDEVECEQDEEGNTDTTKRTRSCDSKWLDETEFLVREAHVWSGSLDEVALNSEVVL